MIVEICRAICIKINLKGDNCYDLSFNNESANNESSLGNHTIKCLLSEFESPHYPSKGNQKALLLLQKLFLDQLALRQI